MFRLSGFDCFFQTDAAVNQGNSGGPLINLKGQVIGINSMKVEGTGGISFAIPMDTAWRVLTQLKERGKVIRPYLGLRMFPLTPQIIAREKHLVKDFPDVSRGVLVISVNKSSPAFTAGIKPGDVIVSMDKQPIKTINDVTNIMGFEIGKTHEFEILRKGSTINLNVTTTPAEGQ